ncbi:GNAT family N-acetyltransferase [Candidatus Frankia nodulisporulans]|uniref:GNAT family N-acetyltransferase n=1 Tax=Candidatus Frankia nodulisporulans TaxID=2060052 RepID=UPI001CDC6552|nr:GNAT family N-acetyltransferase [Candidatus Frankia nodulisporulans]
MAGPAGGQHARRTGDILVRPITADEGPLLRRLRLASVADAAMAFWHTAEVLSSWPADEWTRLARAATDSTTDLIVLAQHGDQAVGLLQGLTPSNRPWLRELASMWIAPRVRGQGGADALVLAALDWSYRVGAEAVKLWVAPGNLAARRLYTRHGFVVLGGPEPTTSDPLVRTFIPMLRTLYPAAPRPAAPRP